MVARFVKIYIYIIKNYKNWHRFLMQLRRIIKLYNYNAYHRNHWPPPVNSTIKKSSSNCSNNGKTGKNLLWLHKTTNKKRRKKNGQTDQKIIKYELSPIGYIKLRHTEHINRNYKQKKNATFRTYKELVKKNKRTKRFFF